MRRHPAAVSGGAGVAGTPVGGCGYPARVLALDVPLREVVTVGAGLAYHDAARVIGCPVGTIKSRVFRTRHKLRRLLKPDHQTPVV